MILAMLYHHVPALVRKKIGGGLLAAMIQEYMKATSTASTRRLASFLGMPLGLQLSEELKSEENSVADAEFLRRTKVTSFRVNISHSEISDVRIRPPLTDFYAQELYVEIFPAHAACGTECCGHDLPKMPLAFMTEMGFPDNVADLILAARKWFSRIDVDNSRSIETAELEQEFLRIGLEMNAARAILKYHDDNETAMLEVKMHLH